MFQFLGRAVARFWPLMLVFWILVVAGVDIVAPRWDEVVEDGEFAYLPDDVPSREAEKLFRDAFANDMLGSSVVLVVRRESRVDGLLETDETFIEKILRPRIELVQPLTDISHAVTPSDGDVEQTYREINQYLSTIWKPAENPWPSSAHENGAAELRRVESITEAVAGAIQDWHADLFPATTDGADSIATPDSISDPEPETGPSVSLAARIARQLEKTNIVEGSHTEKLLGRLRDDDVTANWLPQDEAAEAPNPIILRVRTFSDKSIGNLLKSKDNKASLVVVELATEFLIRGNREIIHNIEQLVGGNDADGLGELHREMLRPPGLDLALSGSATVGRDMRVNAEKSAHDTEFWTVALVVVLLLFIYRAPVLVLIPLATVVVSVELALDLLAILARAGYVDLFSGIEIYSTVVMYGAGVDYCMFLIARYKEELDTGATFEESITESIAKVGAALAASAGTTMCGIGMMVFADFGKFRQAGVAMSFGLFFVLCASLTFTPSLLRLFGRWSFWPQMRTERVSVTGGWVSPTSFVARALQRKWFSGVWDHVGRVLLARPGTVWLATIAVMLPFVAIAIMFYGNLSYGLLSELPPDETSVVGAKAVQAHFPAGQAGPITVLVKNRRVDFRENEGRDAIGELTDALEARKDELQIADIRSIAHPLGLQADKDMASLSGLQRAAQKRLMRRRGIEHYVANKSEAEDIHHLAGHVTRIDIVVKNDPFSRESIDQFEQLERVLKPPPGAGSTNGGGGPQAATLLPEELKHDSEVHFVGATPSIRDLKVVTGGDQVRIDILVIGSVFLILVLLLRKVAISGYLIVSVFFSYLVTLGFTFAAFWAMDPSGFTGLDWKVPMFLFTILIAVGEDYNIYLITRIDEEQLRHGKVQGVTVALSKTGKIISSCGLIMAGTFASLAIGGSLAAMRQLGFALAAGVLLDTFVVRPVLVPAYLILLYRGRFGFLGRFLGAEAGDRTEPSAPQMADPSTTPESSAKTGLSSKAG